MGIGCYAKNHPTATVSTNHAKIMDKTLKSEANILDEAILSSPGLVKMIIS